MDLFVNPLAVLVSLFRRDSPTLAHGRSILPEVGLGIEPVYTENWAALDLSDEEVIAAFDNSPTWHTDSGGVRRLHLLCPDTLIKYGYLHDNEFLASELARTSTSIKIPKMHRLIADEDEDGYVFMVMERIRGPTLAQCWAELSLWRKIMVMWTLRGYVQQLRSIANPQPGRPGPLGLGGYAWFGPMFGGMGAGPFGSYEAMVSWLNGRQAVSKKHFVEHAPSSAPAFDTSSPLVFTHMDLKADNLILDKENRLWIIDFGQAGFYPPPFEYVAMYNMWSGRMVQGREWITRILVGFTTGLYHSYYSTMYRSIWWAVDVCNAAKLE